MSLARVEVYDHGRLLQSRTFPNPFAARIFAEHQRARGFYALVMTPRGEYKP